MLDKINDIHNLSRSILLVIEGLLQILQHETNNSGSPGSWMDVVAKRNQHPPPDLKMRQQDFESMY